MSHRCPALRKRDGQRCENRIANPKQKYCVDHPTPATRWQGPTSSSRSGTRTRALPDPTRTVTVPSQRAKNSPTHSQATQPPSRPRITVSRMEKAVKVVDEVATDGWKEAAANRVASVLTQDVMRQLRAEARGRRGLVDCRLLAKEARFLLSVKNKYHDALGALADHGLRALRRPTLERLVARQFARHIPLPGSEQIEALARTLQVYGILLCLVAGKLRSCSCLQDLSGHLVDENIREIVTDSLNELEVRTLREWSGRLPGS